MADALRSQRPTFRSTYAHTRKQLGWSSRLPRLLDCLVISAFPGDARYVQQVDAGEFAVVDLANGREKGYFERPDGATVQDLRAMIEGHFNAPAERVEERLWIV